MRLCILSILHYTALFVGILLMATPKVRSTISISEANIKEPVEMAVAYENTTEILHGELLFDF